MSYSTTQELWNNFGKDSFTKVRSEIVGTGNGSTGTWELEHDNIISGSFEVYTNGTAVSTASYSIDLDDGTLTLTAGSSETISSNYNYADIPDSWTSEILNQANDELTMSTGRSFESTSVTEYLDVETDQETWFLKNYPVLTMSSLSCNIASSVADAPSWSSSTEGLGYDYLLDSNLGRIRFIDNKPLTGENRIKAVYSYGYSTIPSIVKELEILLATRKMANSAVYKSIFKGNDNFTPVRLEEIEARISELKSMLKKQSISKP